MLPARPAAPRSVLGVADDILAAVRGEESALPAVRSGVLLLLDGVGALSLRSHAGHARHLAGAMSRKDVARTVFPTTTATALTSITTGRPPGEHGLVGYSVRDPATGNIFNELSGWRHSDNDPLQWQPRSTIFERATRLGQQAFAVGIPAYANSGFSRATLRGATFVSAGSVADRIDTAYALAAEHVGAFVYVYVPEVDTAGHAHGVGSAEWLVALEEVDGVLSRTPPPGVGVLVTADHGMINVSSPHHVVLEDGDPRLEGVESIAGEPRMLYVYLAPDADAGAVGDRWRGLSGASASVLSKNEAIDEGLFGDTITEAARQRIGDILVIAKGTWAYYDGRPRDQRSRLMVGQHGALTPDEVLVPWIRLGAFAR